ncbi:MAG: DUF3237 family protein [Gammaproteobacteria bacterium]
MRLLQSVVLATATFLATTAIAQEDAGKRWPVPDVTAPGNEFVMEFYVTISAAVSVGPSEHGIRRFIPITGGRFAGSGIKGEVLAGGADWQLGRPDGVAEVNAIYSIKTDDGAVIEVENQGIITPANGGIGYARTSPRFHAPNGRYDWLNKTLFVGTIAPAAESGAVIIRVFKVL